MAIDRVSYQKVYAVGAYITERIGVEATVDEGQDPKFVLAELKKLCDEVNQANNPHLQQPSNSWLSDVVYGSNRPSDNVPTATPEKQDKEPEISIEDDIRAFTDHEKLKKVYGAIASIDKNIKPVYDEMMDKLLINAVIGTKKIKPNE